MVKHTCTRCGKSFPKLWKLRQHNERQYKCKPIAKPQSSPSTSVIHIREKDRKKEKPKSI